MRLAFLIMLAVATLSGRASWAQELLQSPFPSQEQIRATGAGRVPADLELSVDLSTAGGERRSVRLLFATDWASGTTGSETIVDDFARKREFIVQGGTVESRNPASVVAFRVSEYQNRAGLRRMLDAVFKARGDQGLTTALHACDAASELGVLLPIKGYDAKTKMKPARVGVRVSCGGREIGGFEASEQAAPASFWPWFARAFPTHPDVLTAIRKTGRVPRTAFASYRAADGRQKRSTWSLEGARTVSADHPLASASATIAVPSYSTDALGGPPVALARSAVDGSAAGGAPRSLAEWDTRVARAAAETGQAAAFFESVAGLGQFAPDGRCLPAEAATCRQVAAARDLIGTEPAVSAFVQVVLAEQSGQSAKAIDALASVQDPALRDHPVLQASWALALRKLKPEDLAAARARGLAVDPGPLHFAAVQAYPYNPGYWTDLGDWFAANWHWPAAYFCYDVAASLPVPSSRGPVLHPALRSKQALTARLRTDFPQFFEP